MRTLVTLPSWNIQNVEGLCYLADTEVILRALSMERRQLCSTRTPAYSQAVELLEALTTVPFTVTAAAPLPGSA
jgi:hypothetical protein